MDTSAFSLNTLFSAKGKTALVTGGSKGIGLIISKALVANGATVYLTSRNEKTCKIAASEINSQFSHQKNKKYGKAIGFASDVSTSAGCELVHAFLESSGVSQLHILINNAGTNWSAPLESYPELAFRKVIDLNLFGYFRLVQILLPLLEKGANSPLGPAKIVNMGSINGIDVPSLDTFAYSASKAAVHHLSRVLAFKLGPKRITVNAIAPGPFRTKMMKETLERWEGKIVEGLPMGRIGGEGDMAAVVLWLVGRGGDFVTGAIVPVDGGALVSTSKM